MMKKTVTLMVALLVFVMAGSARAVFPAPPSAKWFLVISQKNTDPDNDGDSLLYQMGFFPSHAICNFYAGVSSVLGTVVIACTQTPVCSSANTAYYFDAIPGSDNDSDDHGRAATIGPFQNKSACVSALTAAAAFANILDGPDGCFSGPTFC